MALFGEGKGISKYINRSEASRKDTALFTRPEEITKLDMLKAQRTEMLRDPRFRSDTILQQEVAKLEDLIRQLGG